MEPTKRVMDEVTRKALIGYAPFSCDSSINFIPEYYTVKKPGSEELVFPAEYQAMFTVRSFTQAEKQRREAISATIADKGGSAATIEQKIEYGRDVLDVSLGCVLDWKNLFDVGTGEEIIYSGDKAKDRAVLDSLRDDVKMEINEFINKISCLTPVEKLGLK